MPFDPITQTYSPSVTTGTQFLQAGDITTGHVGTFTAAGSGTFALEAVLGGGARLSGAATTDNSGGNFQCPRVHAALGGTTLKAIARITMSDATQSDFYFGLASTDTDFTGGAPADGFYFRKDDGDTQIDCITRVGSADGVAATNKATADTSEHWYEIEVEFRSTTAAKVTWKIDGKVIHSADATVTASAFFGLSVEYLSGDNLSTKYVVLKDFWSHQNIIR